MISRKSPSAPVDTRKALERLKLLCARSEQSSGEVRRKLAAWKIAGAEASAILRRLTLDGFVDDNRYARAFTHDKLMFNGWGRRKIMAGLLAKGIDRHTALQAIDETVDPDDYAARAASLMKGRAAGADPTDRALRMKLARFAAARGFEPEVIFSILNSDSFWQSKED